MLPFFLYLLDTSRHYVSPSLGCQYFLIFLCTWPPRGEWSLSPLGDNLLFRSELVPILSDGFTFPNPHTGLFALKSFMGWPKSYRIFIIAFIKIMNAYARGIISMMHGFLYFLSKFGSMPDYVHFPMNSVSTQTARYSENPQ